MALHPQVQAFCDEINAIEVAPLNERPLAEVREGFHDLVMSMQAPGVAVGRVEDRDIPGPNGPIRIRLYWPEGADPAEPLPVYVNYHGSGYVVLSIDTHDGVCRALCKGAGCIVVGVNYCKAPEHRFPKPTEDSWASLQWVAENCAEIGGDPARIAVGGDSAGGCLAAVMAQRAKAEGGPPLVFQLLVYPVTDTDEGRESYKTFADGYVLTAEAMTWFFDCYFNDESERADVRAAPIRADDLSGLPPAMVMTASHDPLFDDGREYAERLKAAGVPTDYRNYEGHIHGFWTATAQFDVANEAHAVACAALRQAFGTGS
jgi:acetyl esterase